MGMEMSHGILKEVPIPENTTLEQFAEQLCRTLGDKRLLREFDTWVEQLYWTHSEKYFVHTNKEDKKKIYEYFNKSSDGAFSRLIQHENGELEFFTYFHNGSMCLEDVLNEEFNNNDIK